MKGSSAAIKYKVLAAATATIGLVLSHAMFANIAFAYCNMLWGIRYEGYSAPASIAFLLAIPYALAIMISFFATYVFIKKYKSR